MYLSFLDTRHVPIRWRNCVCIFVEIWCKTHTVKRTLSSVIQETLTKHYRLRWKEVSCDPERNLLVGQCSTEMLLDVGLQHCVEVLKLSVSDQTYDVYLADGREKQRQLQCLHSSRHLQGRWELMSTHLIVMLIWKKKRRWTGWHKDVRLDTHTVCQEISCICWQGTHTWSHKHSLSKHTNTTPTNASNTRMS